MLSPKIAGYIIALAYISLNTFLLAYCVSCKVHEYLSQQVFIYFIMPCFFSVVGQVTSVNSGTGGSHNAVILFQEGPLGGNGEDRYFEVSFWPEGDTNLVTNKCYLLRGTV